MSPTSRRRATHAGSDSKSIDNAQGPVLNGNQVSIYAELSGLRAHHNGFVSIAR